MSVIIRVDVDSPYGYNSFFKKLLNYISIKTPISLRINFLGYLYHLKKFILFCNENNITCEFFFRRCTIPNKKILNLLNKGNHKIGWHVENSKDFNSFKKEYNYITKKLNKKIIYYTKHGSGTLHGNRTYPPKLGYYHYPEYELDNLLNFGDKLNLNYFYGNGEDPNECIKKQYNNLIYYTDVFWIKKEYRQNKYTINWLIKNAKKKDIIVLIHPFNFYRFKQVNRDFKKLVNLYEINFKRNN